MNNSTHEMILAVLFLIEVFLVVVGGFWMFWDYHSWNKQRKQWWKNRGVKK